MLPRLLLSVVSLLLCSPPALAQGRRDSPPNWRTIEFETTEVTGANVTVSPDGRWLVFSILGHLFRLPVGGGAAEQLTFGPYYDTDPVFSPDGARVAFISDRDGSEGNVFVHELETGEVKQLTHDRWAGRPAWSPDGHTIAYLSFVLDLEHEYAPSAAPAVVRRTAVSGGESEVVSGPPRMISSVFYLPDGRLGWSVFEGRPAWWLWDGRDPIEGATTRIEVLSENGVVSTQRETSGIVHRLVASPTSDGIYARKLPTPRMGGFYPEEEELVFLSLGDDSERHITSVWGTNGWDWGPRFDVTADGGSLYLGKGGRLLELGLPDGSARPIAYRASVTLEILDPVVPPKADLSVPGTTALPRIVHQPIMSPAGNSILLMAAGSIWQQPLANGPAHLVYEGDGLAGGQALSADGRSLALIELNPGIRKLKVLDLDSGEPRTVDSGGNYWQLAWHPDGKRLAYVNRTTSRVVIVDLGSGEAEEILEGLEQPWLSRPRFSADGRTIFFTSGGVFHRLPLAEGADAEPILRLADLSATDSPVLPWVGDAVISPHERWVAFRRGPEIWVAQADLPPTDAQHARRLSLTGGDTFDFTPDGSAVIFAEGNEVWRQPLAPVEPERIPLRLHVKRPTPPPVLLRRVRVVDFIAGDFGPETSIFIEGGRIRWIGSENARGLPEETVILDVAGRFAIPGLFDLHVHNRGGYQAPNNLAYGVTSLRDVHTPLMWLNIFDDWADATDAPIPRSFHAGEMLYGPPEILPTEEDARATMRRDKAGGASLIKVYSTLPWSVHRAVAAEARLLGLPVAAHGTTVKEVTKGVTLGYATLEHAGVRYYDDVLQMLAEAGTRWVPTVGCDVGDWLRLKAEPERIETEKFRAFVLRSRVERELTAGDTVWKSRAYPEIYAQQTASIRAAYARGVKLQAGTDQQEHLSLPGVSLHWELEHLVQAGIPAVEVLRIATQEAAVAVGAGDDLGSLEPNKIADLVLLDANPLEDIKNTRKIWRVIKGGWVFDPEELRPTATSNED
jgi:imidazolonepropionase-like amidohydrolase/Tol biopolymer transport system component